MTAKRALPPSAPSSAPSSAPYSAPFTLEEAIAASTAWQFNCGPAAVCGVLGLKPATIRPFLCDFELRGYTNPTMIRAILKQMRVPYREIFRGYGTALHEKWPTFGIVRIEFEPPLTEPGVPIEAQYRESHYVSVRTNQARFDALSGSPGDATLLDVFDINSFYFAEANQLCGSSHASGNVTGWMSWRDWSEYLIPWIIQRQYPKAPGGWCITHSMEIDLTKWSMPDGDADV